MDRAIADWRVIMVFARRVRSAVNRVLASNRGNAFEVWLAWKAFAFPRWDERDRLRSILNVLLRVRTALRRLRESSSRVKRTV